MDFTGIHQGKNIWLDLFLGIWRVHTVEPERMWQGEDLGQIALWLVFCAFPCPLLVESEEHPRECRLSFWSGAGGGKEQDLELVETWMFGPRFMAPTTHSWFLCSKSWAFLLTLRSYFLYYSEIPVMKRKPAREGGRGDLVDVCREVQQPISLPTLHLGQWLADGHWL